MSARPRVVLDTNVVVSALVFASGRAHRLRAALQSGRIVPLASTATARELVRVLAYPKFGLTDAEQEDLLADYLPWATVVRIPDPPPRVPPCPDPFDQPFLHLAVAGRAAVLVTGDRALLALSGAAGLCPVRTLDAFLAERGA